jgi:hypothetical protein
MRVIERCKRSALTYSARRYANTLRQRLDRYREEQTTLHHELAVHNVAPVGYSEQLRAEQRALHASHADSQLLLADELSLHSTSIYFLTSLRPSRSLSSALLRPPQLSYAESVALSQSIVFALRAQALSETTPSCGFTSLTYCSLDRP